jgi:hypothetical protein
MRLMHRLECMNKQPEHIKKRVAAGSEGQLLLRLNRAGESRQIPERNRRECIEVLRMMLQRGIETHRSTEEGNE